MKKDGLKEGFQASRGEERNNKARRFKRADHQNSHIQTYLRAGGTIYGPCDVSVCSLAPARRYAGGGWDAGGPAGASRSPHEVRLAWAPDSAGPPWFRAVRVLWPLVPLAFEMNEQVDGIQAASVLRSAGAPEGTAEQGASNEAAAQRVSAFDGSRLMWCFSPSLLQLLELIAKSQLPALSGVAQKNYMNILERVVQKVLDDQQNVRPIKELLQMLHLSLCGLVQDMGKSVLVGNINIWVHRMENIMQWQQQLDNIQIKRPTSTGMALTDLPASLQLNIMQCLTDGRDLVSLGQVCPQLGALTEDRLLWKRLCQYHFTDRQIRKRLMVCDKGHLEWKKMYFKLSRCYPHREQYSDTLHLCTHCHILFWKDTNHPCTANNPESCTASLSPQDFINLFNF